MTVYLNFGCSSASGFWCDVAEPAHSRFFREPSRFTAIQAAWPTWHVHEWVWHEMSPKSRATLEQFRRDLIRQCKELAWLGDLTDASKHCGLDRHLEVEKVAGTGMVIKGEISDVFGQRPDTHADPLIVTVDGNDHEFADVLRRAIAFWRTRGF